MKEGIISKSRITQFSFILLNIVAIVGLVWGEYIQMALMINVCVISFLCVLNMGRTIGYADFFAIMLAIISLVFTNILHSAAGVTVIYLNVLLLGFLSRQTKIDNKLFSKIRIVTVILLIAYIVTCDNARLLYRGTTVDCLGNTVNGNTLGILAVIAYFNAELLLINAKKNKVFPLLRLVLLLLSAFYVNLSGCRIALISFFVYITLLFLKKKPFGKRTVQNILLIELMGCFVFTVVYVFFASTGDNVMFMGKELFSGRESLWKSGFDLIKEYPIFGSGNDFLYGTGSDAFASSHNFILGVVKMFGIIPTISLIYILSRHNSNSSYDINSERILQFTKMSILLIGFTESSFISADTCFLLTMLFMGADDSNAVLRELSSPKQNRIKRLKWRI